MCSPDEVSSLFFHGLFGDLTDFSSAGCHLADAKKLTRVTVYGGDAHFPSSFIIESSLLPNQIFLFLKGFAVVGVASLLKSDYRPCKYERSGESR